MNKPYQFGTVGARLQDLGALGARLVCLCLDAPLLEKQFHMYTSLGRFLVYLKTIECLQFISHGVHLLVINVRDLTESKTHLILPELSVFQCSVSIGQRGQFFQFLTSVINMYSLT